MLKPLTIIALVLLIGVAGCKPAPNQPWDEFAIDCAVGYASVYFPEIAEYLPMIITDIYYANQVER